MSFTEDELLVLTNVAREVKVLPDREKVEHLRHNYFQAILDVKELGAGLRAADEFELPFLVDEFLDIVTDWVTQNLALAGITPAEEILAAEVAAKIGAAFDINPDLN